MKILLVEDNDMNREALLRRLERRGYEVVEAIDGRQAVELAGREKPDLILMDIRLPEMDGLEATRLIKGQEATRSIQVIALTAYAMLDDREEALKAGCDDFDTKPVDFERLLKKIEGAIAG